MNSNMLIQLFDHWSISEKDRIALLGLDKDNLTDFDLQNRDSRDRAGHLLAIHKYLRVLFPHNRDLAYSWMSTRIKAFDGRTPVDVVRDYGFAGLLMIRSYLSRMV
jgi:hypothetical protein